jgi:hypothetical protein
MIGSRSKSVFLAVWGRSLNETDPFLCLRRMANLCLACCIFVNHCGISRIGNSPDVSIKREELLNQMGVENQDFRHVDIAQRLS